MNILVGDEERNQVFTKLFSLLENNVCFECKMSNPRWSSVNNGIFLCFKCAGKHRTFNTKVSLIKSCSYDKWTAKELKVMEIGGNKNAAMYYESNGLCMNGIYNYADPLAARYRDELSMKVG